MQADLFFMGCRRKNRGWIGRHAKWGPHEIFLSFNQPGAFTCSHCSHSHCFRSTCIANPSNLACFLSSIVLPPCHEAGDRGVCQHILGTITPRTRAAQGHRGGGAAPGAARLSLVCITIRGLEFDRIRARPRSMRDEKRAPPRHGYGPRRDCWHERGCQRAAWPRRYSFFFLNSGTRFHPQRNTYRLIM